MQKRIDYLDGLRGVAIILVILFHAYSRMYTEIPYGDKYADIPILKYGFLGVQLFFLISGFVILMTLEKSKNYFVFGYKRWIRLFPAMLIATIFLYFTASLFYERPAGQPNFWSVIPGLSFIEPDWIKKALNIDFPILEGAFWSLYLEVRFYIIFGGLFFLFGRNRAIILFFLFFLYSIVVNESIEYLMSIGVESAYRLKHIKLVIHPEFGWFIAGCLAYMYYRREEKRREEKRREEKSGWWLLVLSVLISLISLYIKYREYHTKEFVLIGLLIISAFYLPLISDKIAKILSNRILLFVGFISYPLYLIHENTMISMIVQLNKQFPMIPDFILPFIALIPIVSLAYAITKWGEPTLRKWIDNLIGKKIFK